MPHAFSAAAGAAPSSCASDATVAARLERSVGAASSARATKVSADSGVVGRPARAAKPRHGRADRAARRPASRSKPTVTRVGLSGRHQQPRDALPPGFALGAPGAVAGESVLDSMTFSVDRSSAAMSSADRPSEASVGAAICRPRPSRKRTRMPLESPSRRATKASAAGARRARGVSLA